MGPKRLKGLVLVKDNPVTNVWSRSKVGFPGCGFVMWMERDALRALRRERFQCFLSAPCLPRVGSLLCLFDWSVLTGGHLGAAAGVPHAVLSPLLVVQSYYSTCGGK